MKIVYILTVNKLIFLKTDEKRWNILFPISELVDVYNLDVNYIAENKVVNIEKLSEEKKL